MSFAFAMFSVLLNALAQVVLKSWATSGSLDVTTTIKSWQPYATGVLYLSSIALWFLALRSLPLSVAYPLQAAGYVFVTLAAYLIFTEVPTLLQIAGLVLIIAGVSFYALSLR